MSKIVAVIPARCESKGIKLKNIKDFCGKPLIYWTLLALSKVEAVNEIIVATDCDIIEDVVNSLGIKGIKVYRRIEENAQDKSTTESLMLEYIEQSKLKNEDQFILVQLTSPFTTTEDFSKAIKKYENSRFDSLLSCSRIKRFFWSENGKPLNYDYNKRPRRQEFKGQLVENGAFYINSVRNIKVSKNRLSGKIGIHEMPEYTWIEIDEEHDWYIAETIMYKYILVKSLNNNRINLVLSDVDGVLTDAGMYYTENGDEYKKFSTYDGKAVELLHNKEILFGIVTSEKTDIVERRSKKIKADFVLQGINNKFEIVIELCNKEKIPLKNIAYIGDDLNDLQLIKKVGMAACPSSAVPDIQKVPYIIKLNKEGGKGALREFVDLIIEHNKRILSHSK